MFICVCRAHTHSLTYMQKNSNLAPKHSSIVIFNSVSSPQQNTARETRKVMCALVNPNSYLRSTVKYHQCVRWSVHSTSYFVLKSSDYCNCLLSCWCSSNFCLIDIRNTVNLWQLGNDNEIVVLQNMHRR